MYNEYIMINQSPASYIPPDAEPNSVLNWVVPGRDGHPDVDATIAGVPGVSARQVAGAAGDQIANEYGQQLGAYYEATGTLPTAEEPLSPTGSFAEKVAERIGQLGRRRVRVA